MEILVNVLKCPPFVKSLWVLAHERGPGFSILALIDASFSNI